MKINKKCPLPYDSCRLLICSAVLTSFFVEFPAIVVVHMRCSNNNHKCRGVLENNVGCWKNVVCWVPCDCCLVTTYLHAALRFATAPLCLTATAATATTAAAIAAAVTTPRLWLTLDLYCWHVIRKAIWRNSKLEISKNYVIFVYFQAAVSVLLAVSVLYDEKKQNKILHNISRFLTSR